MNTQAECGTYAAVMRHKRRDEPLDDKCKKAQADYQRDLRARNPDLREHDRWASRTRSRALERLAAMYAEDYDRLVAEERRKERRS